jgi:hypothetical protein
MIRRRSVIDQRINNKGILIRPSDSLSFVVPLILTSWCFLGLSTEFPGGIVVASPGTAVSFARSSQHFGCTFRPATLWQATIPIRGGEIPPSAESDTTTTPIDLSSTMTTNMTQDTTNSTTTTTKPTWTLADARRTLFPIYGEKEVTKFLLIGSIKFFIILALTLTRDTKDTLVVTQCGAEAIAFLKVRVVVCWTSCTRNTLNVQVQLEINCCFLFDLLTDLWSASGSDSIHCAIF